MRNFKNTKGQIRVIETILAVSVIFAAISFVGIFAVRPMSPTYEVTDLEKMGYNALHDLDHQGVLTSLVYGNNAEKWSELRTVLKITLPVDVYFNLTIYDLNKSPINDKKIIYGDPNTFVDARNIVSVSYTLVGTSGNYDPRILLLEITRGA